MGYRKLGAGGTVTILYAVVVDDGCFEIIEIDSGRVLIIFIIIMLN